MTRRSSHSNTSHSATSLLNTLIPLLKISQTDSSTAKFKELGEWLGEKHAITEVLSNSKASL